MNQNFANEGLVSHRRKPIEQTMSSADTQTQILAQLLMLTNQVGKLQEEVVDLRSQLARQPNEKIIETSTGSISATSEPKKSKKAKKEKPEGYIKKPATAFLMWQNESFRAKFKEEHPEEPPKAVASAAGPVWKAMSEEEKAPWLEKYNIAKAEYNLATGKTAEPKKVVTVSDEVPIADEVPVVSSKKAKHEEEKALKAERKAVRAKKRLEREAKKAKEAAAQAAAESHPLTGLMELQQEEVGSDSDSSCSSSQ